MNIGDQIEIPKLVTLYNEQFSNFDDYETLNILTKYSFDEKIPINSDSVKLEEDPESLPGINSNI